MATLIVLKGDQTIAMGPVTISRVAPGLFAANGGGKGLAASSVLRVKADGSRTVEAVSIYDRAQAAFIPEPLDFEPATDQLFLILYGTGIRHAGNVKCTVGETTSKCCSPVPHRPGPDWIRSMCDCPASCQGVGRWMSSSQQITSAPTWFRWCFARRAVAGWSSLRGLASNSDFKLRRC